LIEVVVLGSEEVRELGEGVELIYALSEIDSGFEDVGGVIVAAIGVCSLREDVEHTQALAVGHGLVAHMLDSGLRIGIEAAIKVEVGAFEALGDDGVIVGVVEVGAGDRDIKEGARHLR
jgi:hypothetical protein